MTRLCYETDSEIVSILDDLEYSKMTLKLKGDVETQHIKGLRRCFQAYIRATMFVEALKSSANGQHDYDRFREIQTEARKQLDQYSTEFRLTVIENGADSNRPPVVVHTPSENGGG